MCPVAPSKAAPFPSPRNSGKRIWRTRTGAEQARMRRLGQERVEYWSNTGQNTSRSKATQASLPSGLPCPNPPSKPAANSPHPPPPDTKAQARHSTGEAPACSGWRPGPEFAKQSPAGVSLQRGQDWAVGPCCGPDRGVGVGSNSGQAPVERRGTRGQFDRWQAAWPLSCPVEFGRSNTGQ
jgi:hypothetical protein